MDDRKGWRVGEREESQRERRPMGWETIKVQGPSCCWAGDKGQSGPRPVHLALHSWGGSSPVRVPISVVVTQKVILSHHFVSGDFQGLVNRRQEIFTQTGDLAERKEKAEAGG